jgi:hypothetical protein
MITVTNPKMTNARQIPNSDDAILRAETSRSVSSVPALYKRANWVQRCGRDGGYTSVELSR